MTTTFWTFLWLFLTCSLSSIRSEHTCKDIFHCQCQQTGDDFLFFCPENNPKSDTLLVYVKKSDDDLRNNILHVECRNNFNINLKNDFLILINNTIEPKCSFSTGKLQKIFQEIRDVQVIISELKIDLINVTVDFSQQGFDQITQINVRDSEIDKLNTFLELFPNLITLELEGVEETFENYIFRNNKNLQKLTLSSNKISFPNEVFHHLQQLKLLHSSGENNLSEELFRALINLEHLELWGDPKNLPKKLFEALKTLKTLDIWLYNITEIPEGVFEHLHNLQSLNLTSNNIVKIPQNAFTSLLNLQSIILKNNKIQNISEGLFDNLINITSINLDNNPLEKIPQDLFSKTKSLRKLSMNNCSLKMLPRELFRASVNLKELELSGNQLKKLPDTLFSSLRNLEILDVSSNLFKTLPNDIFKNLTQLILLNLNQNMLHSINAKLFKELKKLKELNLEENKIKTIAQGAFYNLTSLKVFVMARNEYDDSEINETFPLSSRNSQLTGVNLAHNFIRNTRTISHLVKEIRSSFNLDLSHNLISYVKLVDFQPSSWSFNVNFEDNKISTVDFSSWKQLEKSLQSINSISSLYFANNPISCDCTNYNFYLYIQDYKKSMKPSKIFNVDAEGLMCRQENISFDQISPFLLTCELDKKSFKYSKCPQKCKCNWRPHDQAIYVDCSNSQLTSIPNIELPENIEFSQTVLNLDNNSITQGPAETLKGIQNVTQLFLSHNNIQSFEWIPRALTVLTLDDNQLTVLEGSLLTLMITSKVMNVTLAYNPWICDCQAVKFNEFLKQNQHIKLDTNEILCTQSYEKLVELKPIDLCPEWQITYTIIVVVSFLLLLAILLSLYFYYQQQLKVWLFAKGWLLFWMTEEEIDKDKPYDAFISYSHKDEPFVTEELVPVLESGENPYKLCLHYRNWIPGEFITKQITDSVLDSRRTIVVLSPNFLESVWGKMEFRTAHTQAMTEGHARVIVVLYGEVNIKELDPELQTYLKTNTYVQWKDPYFWNKLRYALPHSNRVPKRRKHLRRKVGDVLTLDAIVQCKEDIGRIESFKTN